MKLAIPAGFVPVLVCHVGIGPEQKCEMVLAGRNPQFDENGNLWFEDKFYKGGHEVAPEEYMYAQDKSIYTADLTVIPADKIIQLRFTAQK